MKTVLIIPLLSFVLSLLFSTCIYADNQSDHYIQLIKRMQQTLLVDQKGTAANIARYYTRHVHINNEPQSYQQIEHTLQQFYAQHHATKITYHYFTVSGNNVSWYEEISSLNNRNQPQKHSLLELAEIKQHKISRLYAAGSTHL